MAVSPETGRSTQDRFAPVAVALLGILLALRFYAVARHYASDVVFWDQWDFMKPLFEESGWVALFRQQHGPHREGLGGLVLGLLYPATHWSGLGAAWFSVSMMCISAALAVACVWRLTGRATFADAVLPLVFIAPTASEIYAGPINPAHGPLPLFLVLSAASALVFLQGRARPAALGLIAALSVYTGFAIFLAPLLTLLLLCACVRDWRSGDRGAALVALAGCLLVAASALSFAQDYRFDPAMDCYQFPDPRPWRYAPFAGLVLLRPYASFNHLTYPIAGSAIVLLLLGCALAAWSLRQVLRKERSALAEVQFVLASFSVLFVLESAVARVCAGLGMAGSTRYVPYALPLAVAFYLTLRTVAMGSAVRNALLGIFAAAAVAANASQSASLGEARMYKNWKEGWASCYRAKHDIAGCDRDTRGVYPFPDRTHLQQKLDYLEAHHLSLFR